MLSDIRDRTEDKPSWWVRVGNLLIDVFFALAIPLIVWHFTNLKMAAFCAFGFNGYLILLQTLRGHTIDYFRLTLVTVALLALLCSFGIF